MTRIGPWLSLVFWVIVLQLLVLSQIEVSGYLSPYLYPLVIVLAPANFNRYGLLIIGALLGIAMDFHEGSGGLHLMATSLLAYMRPWMLNAVIPRAAEEQLRPPRFGLGQVVHAVAAVLWPPPRLALSLGQPRRSRLVLGPFTKPYQYCGQRILGDCHWMVLS